MLKIGLSLLLATGSLNLFAQSEAESYCLGHGGALGLHAELNIQHQPTGVEKVFCEFMNPHEGFKMIAPETLASTISTIAVSMFRHKPEQNRNDAKASSPAYSYCTVKLKGTYTNWRKITTGDESGTCSFLDGSEISDWALVYGAQRLPILNSLLAFKE